MVNGRKNIMKERKKKQEGLIETKCKRQKKGKICRKRLMKERENRRQTESEAVRGKRVRETLTKST